MQGLRYGASLLKTDRFGDPSPRRRLPHGLLTLVASVSTSPVFSSLYLCLKHAPKERFKAYITRRVDFLIFHGHWVVRRTYRSVSGKSRGYQYKRKVYPLKEEWVGWPRTSRVTSNQISIHLKRSMLDFRRQDAIPDKGLGCWSCSELLLPC